MVIDHHSSIIDLLAVGPMFRGELLPILGVKETVRMSMLSKKFHEVIDCNKYIEGASLPYLNKVFSVDKDIVTNFQPHQLAFQKQHGVTNFSIKHLKSIMIISSF